MIYYVGYYADAENKQNRNAVLSATNKMRYIISALEQMCEPFLVVSCTVTKNKNGCKGIKEKITDNAYCKCFRSFGRRNIITKLLDVVMMNLQLFLFLLFNVKKEDTILVYHATSYCKLIPLIKKLKKCRFILEVEEIYADVQGDDSLRKKEQYIFSEADAFILATPLLNEKVNQQRKPYTAIYGTYMVEKDRGTHFDDGKTHILYAGTFERRKGGTVAVATAEYLDESYHVHVLGFGKEEDKAFLLSEIDRVKELTDCQVSFDGCLSGEEYIQFIQKCHIGLSPQNPDAEYNTTSFPSKILSYLSNGLRVVSIRIPAIEGSAVRDYITFYDVQTPQEIAMAIKSIDIKDQYDSRKHIQELSEQFKRELKLLLER